MRTRRQSATVFGLLAAAGLTAGAWAQTTPPADDAGALSGPKVTPARETTRTLVQRDFDGKLKRIDGDPIAAALDLLNLDKDSRAAADAVLGARAAEMDVLVRDHLKEIAELANARQAGDQARARELMREVLQAARPMLQKGPLVDQVAAALPADKGAELKRLVEEYAKAGVEERMDEGAADEAPARRGDRAGRPTRMQANMAERLQGFGQELRRSYERVFGNRAADFQKLVKDLDLTPEQEARVQRIFTDLFQKTYGKPTPAQRTKAFFDAYKLMNDEQRARFREMVASTRDGGGGEADPMGDSPQPPKDIPTPPKPESKPDRKP